MIHFLAAASLMLITGSVANAHPAPVPHTHSPSEVLTDDGKMEAMICPANAS
jgi:hypothetical protein